VEDRSPHREKMHSSHESSERSASQTRVKAIVSQKPLRARKEEEKDKCRQKPRMRERPIAQMSHFTSRTTSSAIQYQQCSTLNSSSHNAITL